MGTIWSQLWPSSCPMTAAWSKISGSILRQDSTTSINKLSSNQLFPASAISQPPIKRKSLIKLTLSSTKRAKSTTYSSLHLEKYNFPITQARCSNVHRIALPQMWIGLLPSLPKCDESHLCFLFGCPYDFWHELCIDTIVVYNRNSDVYNPRDRRSAHQSVRSRVGEIHAFHQLVY